LNVDYGRDKDSEKPMSSRNPRNFSLPPEGEIVAVKGALSGARDVIDRALEELSGRLGPDTSLRQACLYSLEGGKRFRAAVVLLLAQALNPKREVIDAAVAIECFHAASLIADDLPCMDDDGERREKPAAHKAFGEATALLASYALIGAGYELLTDAADHLVKKCGVTAEEAAKCCLLAVRSVSHCTGIRGACGGQHIDLFPPDYSESTLREILDRKTVTLFEISFVLGWVFSGGDVAKLDDVKKLAYHFGMAFQIVDDLGDLEQDAQREGAVNLALAMGVEKAENTLREELRAYRAQLKALEIDTRELEGLALLLEAKGYAFSAEKRGSLHA
jgi:geranylgeranyl diphosphate synthase type II